jgi:hypothetical protein
VGGIGCGIDDDGPEMLCRICREDLCQEVKAALGEKSRMARAYDFMSRRAPGWRVEVHCSTGHTNVVEGTGGVDCPCP